ncbi:hypothetical protein PROFUN_14427 [Planoprotostelium fungivorum]|uniref:FZ domain-containing protein n=1 Tax=Planoprotostelium fungivorum TaxID=1890364 RepID=A0A2P6N0A9_9EUKA|nr:hypothetical protein PROFUN_14427 [Planoprotostelium fungivorum]
MSGVTVAILYLFSICFGQNCTDIASQDDCVRNVMPCAEKCDHVERLPGAIMEKKKRMQNYREEKHIDQVTWIGIGLGSFFAVTALIVLSSYLIYKHITRRRQRQYHAIQ